VPSSLASRYVGEKGEGFPGVTKFGIWRLGRVTSFQYQRGTRKIRGRDSDEKCLWKRIGNTFSGTYGIIVQQQFKKNKKEKEKLADFEKGATLFLGRLPKGTGKKFTTADFERLYQNRGRGLRPEGRWKLKINN